MKKLSAPSPLTQQDIVSAAITVLTKHGVDGFNMRLLAEQLGVTPGAAYRHVGGKEAVLALAADRILSSIQIDSPDKRPWQEQLFSLGSAYRQAYALYPGLAAYLVLHISEVSAIQKLLDYTIGILREAGLHKKDALRTAAVLNTFISASVGTPQVATQSRPGRPAVRRMQRSPSELDDSNFEYGLRLILRGIKHSA